MGNKICTSLEQSKKLLELGIDINTADMHYLKHSLENFYNPIPFIGKLHDQLPCWSLAALFSVLPEYIKFDGHTWKFYNDHCGIYYMNADTYDTDTFSANSENLVDACYELIIKLKERDLI